MPETADRQSFQGVFVSHSSHDRALAYAIKDKIESWGFRVFLDFESIAGGASWETEIYAALDQSVALVICATAKALESKWVFAEISIARYKKIPVIPLQLTPCEWPDHIRATTQIIDMGGHPAEGYKKLRESLEKLSPGRETWPSDKCPYPGLPAFQEEEAKVFFGREKEILETIACLRPGGERKPFLCIIGPSGCGKSSFIRAGVIPALKKGVIPGSEDWIFVPPFTPGLTPVRNLAMSLGAADHRLGGVRDIEQKLRQEKGLAYLLLDLLALKGSRKTPVLLIFDQLEEIERQAPRAEAEAFLKTVCDALEDVEIPLHVQATLRSDFVTNCLDYPGLARLLQKGSRLLGKMDKSALRQAILGPARAAGMGFEEGVVEDILDDAQGGDALPLLADALRQLWFRARERGEKIIRASDYSATGRVSDGLALRAQAIIEAVAPAEREGVLQSLIELADVDEKGEFTRRRVDLASVPKEARRGIHLFIEARLLTASKDSVEASHEVLFRAASKDSVEAAHEALFRKWPLLRSRLEERSDVLRLKREVERSALEWEAHHRSEAYLWRGDRLASASNLKKSESWPEGDIRGRFIEASERADQTLKNRESELLANRVLREYHEDPERGILLALAAVREYAPTARALLALHTSLAASRVCGTLRHEAACKSAKTDRDGARIVTASDDKSARIWDAAFGREIHRLVGHERGVAGAVFSPDGKCVLTVSDDNRARIWDAAAGRDIAVLEGHDDGVMAGAFSPDGTLVVTASKDATARIWSSPSGRLKHVLRGHARRVNGAAFSPDGKSVLTAGDDKQARIWEARSGRLLQILEGHEHRITGAAFSPDGARVVTASRDYTARIWETASGKEIQVLRGHANSVTAAVFSPDGERVATASWDHTARLWEAASGKLLHVLRGHDHIVFGAAFSPDGARVVTASWDHTARIWEAASGRAVAVLRGHENSVTGAVFTPDGARVLTVSDDHAVRIWDADSGRETRVLKGHEDSVFNAVFSPDGGRVATASGDHTARIWDVETGRELRSLAGHDDSVFLAAFHPKGGRLVTAGRERTARIWDVASGREIRRLSGHEDTVFDAAYHPDGRWIVTASRDHTARIWEADTGRELRVLRGHGDAVFRAAFSADGARLVTASWDHTARIWDAASGRELQALLDHKDSVFDAGFDPEGTRVVTASRDGTARVWNAATGQPIHVLTGHVKSVSEAAFSPDGARIVTASLDRTARIWDAASGREIHILAGHENSVTSAAFNPAGTRVVTVSQDHTARIWDAASGRELHVLRGHERRVNGAAFSPDGTRVVTASGDRTARIWRIFDTDELIALAGSKVFRELTAAERKEYGLPPLQAL